MERRLFRSRRERMIGGVCGGLAEYFGVDPTLVRVLAVILALIDGVGVLAYVLLWVLVPEEPAEGGVDMSDTPENPTPETTGPAEAAAPTYSAPTYTPPAEPAAPPVAPPAPAPSQPVYAAPQPITGRDSAQEARKGGVMGGVILIVLGGIFLVSQFVPGIDIGKLWPLILIAIGIGIVLRRR